MKRTFQTIGYYTFFILTYSLLYIATTFILSAYEDSWDESGGPIWQLSAMEPETLMAYLLWFVPMFPFGLIIPKGILNIIAVCIITPTLVAWIYDRFNAKKYAMTINAAFSSVALLMIILFFW